MNNQQVIGRSREIEILHQVLKSDKAEFVAIYGRRRIGKTFLISRFFKPAKNSIFLSVIGTKEAPLKEQINHFMTRIGEVFFNGVTPQIGKSWDEVFSSLQNAIGTVNKNKKIIIFMDELPWMATRNSRLLQSLDYYWNQYWSHNPKVKLIICGSSASWIINKIINNKGGLHNRITRKIQLKPFNLRETKAFLGANHVKLNNQQIVQLYMLTGGIPYYLGKITSRHSASQMIEELAFMPDGMLLKEFKNLLSSLFDDPTNYEELLHIISKNRYGLSQQAIVEKSNTLSKGGRVTEKLNALKEAGFIIAFKPYGNKKKQIYYKIIDEYVLFYFNWIEPIIENLENCAIEKGYWQGIQNTPAWHSWAGYAFESICYKHLSQIREKLEIPVTAMAATWRYVPRKQSEEDGTQIDLLFDRKDGCITICEIKYTNEAFVIDKSYAKKLMKKGEIFSNKTRIRKQQFIAMISANGVKDNLYSDELLCNVATLEDLF